MKQHWEKPIHAKNKLLMEATVLTATPPTTLPTVHFVDNEYDCGEIPLVRNAADAKLIVGVITDRHIVASWSRRIEILWTPRRTSA